MVVVAQILNIRGDPKGSRKDIYFIKSVGKTAQNERIHGSHKTPI